MGAANRKRSDGQIEVQTEAEISRQTEVRHTGRADFDADRRCVGTAGAAAEFNSDFDSADAFIWQAQGSRLVPVPRVNRVEMTLLKGIDRVRDTLMENTERFAKGLPANNALLWGARGMGKSSLVKGLPCRCQRQRGPRQA
jgi:predicted AAA+ superfamily ATPase